MSAVLISLVMIKKRYLRPSRDLPLYSSYSSSSSFSLYGTTSYISTPDILLFFPKRLTKLQSNSTLSLSSLPPRSSFAFDNQEHRQTAYDRSSRYQCPINHSFDQRHNYSCRHYQPALVPGLRHKRTALEVL